jgi:hypothetical protein
MWRVIAVKVDGPAARVSGIPTSSARTGRWLLCRTRRLRPRLGAQPELLRLASAEEFERGFDTLLLAGVGISE